LVSTGADDDVESSFARPAAVVRKLDRGEPEPEATAAVSDASGQALEPSDAFPF